MPAVVAGSCRTCRPALGPLLLEAHFGGWNWPFKAEICSVSKHIRFSDQSVTLVRPRQRYIVTRDCNARRGLLSRWTCLRRN